MDKAVQIIPFQFFICHKMSTDKLFLITLRIFCRQLSPIRFCFDTQCISRNPIPKVTPPVCTPYVSFTSLKYLHQTIPPLSRIPPSRRQGLQNSIEGKPSLPALLWLLYFRLIFHMILSPFRSKLHDSFTLIE